MFEQNDGAVIGGTHQALFDWTAEDGDTVLVKFAIPEGFDPGEITVNLNNSKTAITVAIPNEPPLLCGALAGAVSDASLSVESGVAVLALKKVEAAPWELVVVSVHPETKEIDPKSAFLLFEVHSVRNQILTDDGTDYVSLLKASASAGYLKAISVIANLSVQNELPGVQRQGIEWLMLAADKYNDVKSMALIGWYLGNVHGYEDRAIEYLNRAIALGYQRAWWVLGMMYSPYSGFCDEFEKKNAGKAVEFFEKAGTDKEVLEELLKLYERGGDGLKPDSAKVAELKAALGIEESSGVGYAIAATCVAALAITLGVFFSRQRGGRD